MSQAVLFKQEGQHIYDYTNVYDPDIDGADPSASGKIIPAVLSIVIDNRTSEWKIYLVKSVDSRTFKCTYTDFPYKTIDRRSMILNYGNDVFMLYYDNRTSPTRLTVDAKMILFGSNIASYRLVKNSNVISYVLRQSGTSSEYAVSQVPVVEVTDKYVDGVRRCNTCYTTATLVDGDIVTLELFDSTGVMIAEVELIARKSTILNSASAALNPITGFSASANQMVGEDWYLYKGQAKNNLSIFPEVHFADGTSFVVPVDNNACYLYGMEDVDTNMVGNKYPILVKYYINSRYTVDPSLNVVAGTKRVLSSEHNIVILEKPVGSISKISVVPVWNANTNNYSLKMLAYNEERDGVSDVTSKIMNDSSGAGGVKTSVLTAGSFSPTTFGSLQEFTVRFNIPADNGYSVNYTQSFAIILKNPAELPSTGSGRDRFQIVNPDNHDIVYGIDNVTYNRPVIYWDSTADNSSGRHYISTEEFPTESAFLETFYRLACPPANTTAGESQAVTPTHFRYRDVSGNLLTSTYRINEYHRGIIINSLAGTPVTGGTIVMEFIYRVAGADVAIIYGVPVTVEQKDGSYTPDAND